MKAIDNICEVLLKLDEGRYDHSLCKKLIESLKELASDSDFQLQVGIKLTESHDSMREGPFSPNIDIPYFVIEMLSKSGRKEAIEPLMKMLNYGHARGSNHNDEFEPIAIEASKVLEVLVGDDSELQYQVGLVGLNSWRRNWGIDMLVKSGRKEAIEPLKEILRRFDYNNTVQTAMKALKTLGYED